MQGRPVRNRFSRFRSRNSAHVVSPQVLSRYRLRLITLLSEAMPPLLKDADVIDARVHVAVEPMRKRDEKA